MSIKLQIVDTIKNINNQIPEKKEEKLKINHNTSDKLQNIINPKILTKEEEPKVEESKVGSIADRLKVFNYQMSTKKEGKEKPKEEIKKTGNIADKLKAFNEPINTKKGEEKHKEENKVSISIADKLKSLNNQNKTKKEEMKNQRKKSMKT